jgi:class 3 adenylate cyclase
VRGLPEGQTITFLFTDVESSTRLWELDSENMRVALARHDALIEASVAEHDGVIPTRSSNRHWRKVCRWPGGWRSIRRTTTAPKIFI